MNNVGKHSKPGGGCVVMMGWMTLGGFAIVALVWEVIPWLI